MNLLTTSLCLVNSPVFINKRANCLLSQSCHHCLVGAIIGPCPICTRKCILLWICMSVWVLVLACRGHLLHLRVNILAVWITPPCYSHSFVKLPVIGTVDLEGAKDKVMDEKWTGNTFCKASPIQQLYYHSSNKYARTYIDFYMLDRLGKNPTYYERCVVEVTIFTCFIFSIMHLSHAYVSS